MANWELKGCCHHDQKVFLATIGIFTVVILVLWRTFILTPFKLITVFLHEASHAIACKLTCGEMAASTVLLVVKLVWVEDSIGCLLDSNATWLISSLITSTANCLTYADMQVEGIQVHANEGGLTQTRGGIYWIILPAGYLGSSFWGMVFILASTTLLTTRIAAGCFALALFIVLCVAKNWTLRGLCIGFIIFLAVVWVLQEYTKFRILRYIILFIGVMNSLFSVYDIYDDLISRRVHSSDAEKFAELCFCPCNGVAWGVIWGMISFIFLCGAIYVGLVILS